jgi:hypothetical protein
LGASSYRKHGKMLGLSAMTISLGWNPVAQG